MVDQDLIIAMQYMFECFVAQEDTYGKKYSATNVQEAIYGGTVEAPRILLARTDLPGGPIGDEMWYRLTVGLSHEVISW